MKTLDELNQQIEELQRKVDDLSKGIAHGPEGHTKERLVKDRESAESLWKKDLAWYPYPLRLKGGAFVPPSERKADTRAAAYARATAGGEKGERHEMVLALSAGAPQFPLVAGALHTLCENKIAFDAIYTTGGSVLLGLMLVAPARKNTGDNFKDAMAGLEGLVDRLGVADPIYRRLPIGYKAFQKRGFFGKEIQRWANHFKLPPHGPGLFPDDARAVRSANAEKLVSQSNVGDFVNAVADTVNDRVENRYVSRYRRLQNDWVDLVASAIIPPRIGPTSQGLCDPLPFLEELVDFDELKANRRETGKFFVNLWNLTDGAMDLFSRELITPEVVRAALAFPFIYPPVKIGQSYYAEGADHDPVNLAGLLGLTANGAIEKVLVIDMLGSIAEVLVREPVGLWDAYGLSILTPVVALAQAHWRSFQDALIKAHRNAVDAPQLMQRLEFNVAKKIPRAEWHTITDWSHSNLSRLFKIGQDAGDAYLKKYRPRGAWTSESIEIPK